MTEARLPPGLAAGECVVLFDGVCKLCNGWAKFLIRHDPARQFRLASVQSAQGQALLAWYGLPTDRFDTMALIDEAGLHVRSTALLRIVSRLPQPWHALRLLRLVPRPLRDWCYDRIALNRYRLFGRHAVCLLPTADHAERFLHD
ncbi:thiol-disulfide oxidoreductase DCC family protein [Ectopseudomonas guguanensis]|uniref:thiol-disulfide oxidoreductase DCC family protein n=1 Tax=Ectopseudomonas guguanensis TaxID=1198456 RepID=UPI0012D6EF09|nr:MULTISPECIES: thiol-disulfide oxidoreductase DCC family protein [Pseudomonas]MPT20655.1 thiol-disulfide oxidoreductase DCC family protein [Pseudomonas sp.]WJH56860.1 thiol-disulfide oxidoreductase DCC family protein [Pseudomonas guguanensis]